MPELKTGLWLYGGKHCGVCHALKPQIESYLTKSWSKLPFHYIDCEEETKACAQSQVFTLPVLRLYFDGRLYLEEVQVFSLQRFFKEIDRLCSEYYAA